MSLAQKVRSAFMRRMADPARLERRRRRAEKKRLAQGRPHCILYFHQVDDPYSHLAAQVLGRLVERYDVELEPRVVGRPPAIAVHDGDLFDAWARRECALIAPWYGLRYDDPGDRPAPECVALGERILVGQEGSNEFAEVAVAVGEAVASNDEDGLATLREKYGASEAASARARVAENAKLRHKLGHYLGAMFTYEGEWYWGIDRLHHLERRLDALGARRTGAPEGPSAQRRRTAPERIESERRITLEFFPSIRSPYTCISFDRIASLAERYPVDLVTRPVLPMMMRGVKADLRKGRYIFTDTKREAEDLGLPFGNAWDPIGEPVRRGYSLWPWARDAGKGFEYLESFSRGCFAEGIDAYSERGLRQIVERVGLSWDEAVNQLDDTEWEAELEENVMEMIGSGSWGVPTFRLPAADGEPEFTLWGQDRIWLLEEEIARRLTG